MRSPSRPAVLAAVGAGGALGALLRYAAQLASPDPAPLTSIPWTVLAINAVGCLAMGLLMGWLHDRPSTHPLVRPFLGTGVLGGFTTFSTFAVESVHLAGHRPALASAYAIGTPLLAVACVALGFGAVRRVAPLPRGIDALSEETPPQAREGEP